MITCSSLRSGPGARSSSPTTFGTSPAPERFGIRAMSLGEYLRGAFEQAMAKVRDSDPD